MGLFQPLVGVGALVLFGIAIFTSTLGRSPIATTSANNGGRKFGGIAASLPLSEEARRLQLLMYTKCFQAPQFTVQGRTGKCDIMHLPTKSYYKWPTDEFRKADHVTVDASRCSRFLENLRVDDVATKKTRLNKFDVKLRPGSTDHDVFLQVYCGGPTGDFGFMPHLARFLPLDGPISILDAGANLGGASILFAQLIAFNGEVLGVDANPMTYELLQDNIRSWADTVTTVKSAIVAHDVAQSGATMNFTGDSNQYWGFRVEHKGSENKKATRVVHTVPTTSLTMLKEQSRYKRFDFIKLDIEGEEKQLLRDRASIDVLCEARCIFMELHDRFEPGCREAFQSFMADGCAAGNRFGHVTTTGEYMLYCKNKILYPDWQANHATQQQAQPQLQASDGSA